MATREPSCESLERKVATCWRFPELELFCWAGVTIWLCAMLNASASEIIPPCLRTEEEIVTNRGECFIVLVIGATSTKRTDSRENYATTPSRCHLGSSRVAVTGPDPAYRELRAQQFSHFRTCL